MASLHNMKPEKVIKTFGRAGWRYDRRANMENLNEDQIKRQDFVDNKIYELVNQLVPSEKKDRMEHRDDRRYQRYHPTLAC